MLEFAPYFSAVAGLALGWTLARVGHRRAARSLEARCEAIRGTGDGTVVLSSALEIIEQDENARTALADIQASAASCATGRNLPAIIVDQLTTGREGPRVLRTESQRFYEVWASPPGDDPARLRSLVIRDVTERRVGESKLMRLAHYDSLTGLANRRLFIDQLADALESSKKRAQPLALLYIDLDRFKEINDTLGHGAGDEMLQIVAERFQQQLEEAGFGSTAGAAANVCRLGGDEFAVVLPAMSDEDVAAVAAQEVLQAASMPMVVSGRSTVASASIGIAVSPRDGSDVETLVKHADAALYAAKGHGRARFEFYHPSFSRDSDRRHEIEQQLRLAIERDELRLHYQPKVDLQTNKVAGFEALLRWENDLLGAVGPYEFIPIAEERGLISEIGAWCIDAACAQIRAWKDTGLTPVPIAVNVSSSQFGTSNMHFVVSDALMRHSLDPTAIEIELTESLLLQNNDDTSLCLRDLRAIGVRVALDDFGTGYSALTYLNQFPLDTVKMDRGFLRELENSETAAGIVSAVVSMCHSLGLKVIAEGVDSEQQLHLLREMGCEEAQGFLFAPALPPDQITHYLGRVGEPQPLISPKTATPGMIRPPAGASTVEVLDEAITEIKRSPRMRTRGPTRVLAIDSQDGSIGPIAMRLMRLGFDVHHAATPDEARLLVTDDGVTVDVVVASPRVDPARSAEVIEAIAKHNDDAKPALIVLGDEPDAEQRTRIREGEARWVMWSPFEDAELRFLLNASVSRPDDLECRRVPRVPINGMAWIRAGSRRESGVLANLSENGAFIETGSEFEPGSNVRVEFALPTGRIRTYAEVSYRVDDDQAQGRNTNTGIGVKFYELDAVVEATIRETIERQALRYLP